MRAQHILSGIILLTLSQFAFALSINEQRNAFEAAYAAVKKGQNPSVPTLKDYPLYPYLEYEVIRRNFAKTSEKKIKRFIENYENSSMAENLWTKWLGRLAKEKRWKEIRTIYSPDSAGIEARCYYLEALVHSREKKSALMRAEKLWMSPNSRPKGCNSLFAQLRKNKILTKDKYWQRIDIALEKGRTKLIRQLIKYLPDDEQKLAQLLITSHKNPKKALKDKQLGGGRYSRRVIAHALKRIARKNYKEAQTLWKKYRTQYTFSKQEQANIESYLTVRAALKHDSKALDRFASIPDEYRSDNANAWMARMSLREGNWKKLDKAINAMSDKESERDIWKYWKARALQKTGNELEANEIYESLAGNATFYGFLSADHQKKPYSVLASEDQDWEPCIEKVQQTKAIQRALEWFRLGHSSRAKREWFWALRHLNKEGKLAAAALALEIDQPLLAVSSVAKTRDWNQVGLRFPMLYRRLVQTMASQHGVNPAWVYGIMRRESVFNKQAISGARAMGLMQLLPSTARDVGKKLGLRKVHKSDLLKPEMNVKLGSAYLSQMLGKFDGSYIKATAAYNAGPGRIKQWAPQKTIDADRWVESIPFTETRKYVRAVMAYTTIYDHKLTKGSGKRISDRLFPVGNHRLN
jgi:soluble lytic murein transglycosylase